MRKTISALLATAFSVAPCFSGVGTLNEKPFFGAFVAQQQREVNYRVMPDGQFTANIVKRDGSEFLKGEIKLRFFLEERRSGEDKGWTWKKFDDSQALSEQKPTLEPEKEEKIEMILTASNKAKVKVTYVFSKKGGVAFDIALLDKGEADQDLRVGFDLILPAMHAYEEAEGERELKKATKDSRMSFKTEKGRPTRLLMMTKGEDFMTEHAEALQEGIVELEFESDEFKGAELELLIPPKGGGVLTYEGDSGKPIYNRGTFRITLDPERKKSGPIGVITVD